MSEKLLEILIPTYRRPESAIGAIDSALASGDPRLSVFCHSNGFDEQLETASTLRPTLRYGYFPDNRGATENFRRLISDSRAKYVLLLSDEDQINSDEITGFLDYLEQIDCGFVMSGIHNTDGTPYFSIASISENSITNKDIMEFFTIHPTYVSGYCFRREFLNQEDIDRIFITHPANVYPHLLLRNHLVKKYSVGIFPKNITIKGIEASTGGDSHDHISIKIDNNRSSEGLKNVLLNPKIYGEMARIEQFQYIAPKILDDLDILDITGKYYSRFYLLSAWLKMTIDANLFAADDSINIDKLNMLKVKLKNLKQDYKIIVYYNKIVSCRHESIRRHIVNMLWIVAKILKTIFLVERFGIFVTCKFIADRRR